VSLFSDPLLEEDMKKQLIWALSIVSMMTFGCSSDSGSSNDNSTSQENPPSTDNPSDKDACGGCSQGSICAKNGKCYENAACASCSAQQVCVGGSCYASDSLCARCAVDQVCKKDQCYAANDPCLACKDDEVCSDQRCTKPTSPCDLCGPTESCINDTCEPCPNTVCGNVCCEAGEVCDIYSNECSPVCDFTGLAPCDGLCCETDMICTLQGKCDRECEFGSSCGDSQICCGENEICYNDDYCAPRCDDDAVLCGPPYAEICCNPGQVCSNEKCVADCASSETACGKDLNICCDNNSEICIFNKCLTRGTKCEKNEDCALWEFCDTGSYTCVSQDENDANCIYRPPVGTFTPKNKWHWSGEVYGQPIVINLTDDNGDGKVDQNDIPEIVFVQSSKAVMALDGATGKVTAMSSETIYNSYNDIAAADIDNDGMIEVLLPTSVSDASKSGLYALNLVKQSDNSYKWVQKHFIKTPNLLYASAYWADLHPTVADIDSDTIPEIVTTRGIIKGNSDWSKFICTLNLPYIGTWYHDFFAVADLDQDGNMEIIDRDIYDMSVTNGSECKMILPRSEEGWYYSAVADLLPNDNDPNYPGELIPEIVRVSSGRVSVWKVYKNEKINADGSKSVQWSQRKIWDKPQTSSSGGGNPVIADFDGDGHADIGVAGRTHYSVFNGQTGSIVWASKTQDASSERTGSSVFDFDGDGIAEVVYRDEQYLRIYSGPGAGHNPDGSVIDQDGDGYMDAKLLWSIPKTSGTVIEYPIIADVDNDGRTEIVIGSDYETPPTGTKPELGLDVYNDAYDNWVRTRRIWNQHAYHVTNINEDGTVPVHEEANWLNKRLNNYRANTQPDDLFNAPDLIGGELTSDQNLCPDAHVLTATIINEGSLTAKDVWVSFYIKGVSMADGSTDDIYLGSVQSKDSITPGSSAQVSFTWNMTGTYVKNGGSATLTLPQTVSFTVDNAPNRPSDEFKNECNENNNTTSGTVIPACPIF